MFAFALVLYPYTQEIFKDQHRQGDLSLTPGAVITDINKDGEWWEGSLQGTRGCFPSNYVSTTVIGKAKCVHNYYASKLDELNIQQISPLAGKIGAFSVENRVNL